MIDHTEDIKLIRSWDRTVALLTDGEIEKLYRQYSRETRSAGWLFIGEGTKARFLDWVFVSPFDSILDERGDD